MSSDPYQPCPAGRDKKLKFCCGPEIMDDLARIEAAMEGEQWVSALELTQRALEKRPDRACLLMQLGRLQLVAGQTEPARQTAQRLQAVAPDSPAGAALLASLHSLEGPAEAAVRWLSEALSLLPHRSMPPVVYEALQRVAVRLAVQEEDWLAAKVLLRLALQISRGQDEELLRLHGVVAGHMREETPVEQSLGLLVPELPSGRYPAELSARFQRAVLDALLGRWRLAVAALEALARELPHEPAIWRNLGTIHRWLLRPQAAAEAFRQLARIPGLPPEEAVEAEATAQMLLSETSEDRIRYTVTTWAVSDLAALKEHLLSSRQVRSLPVPPAEAGAAQPPPQAAFELLDRPLPASSAGLTREKVPHVMGVLLVYGKETDRPARVELTALEGAGLEPAERVLSALAGAWLAEILQQRVVGRIHPSLASMVPLAFPADTPPELQERLTREERQLYLLSIWPNLAMQVLDGKTPRQAVSDPEGARRVQALILLMEYAFPSGDDRFDKLRRALGLPPLAGIDPAGSDLSSLPLLAWLRVETSKLRDEQLVQGLKLALQTDCRLLLARLGREATARPSLEARSDLDLPELYLEWSQLADTPDQALERIRKAQELAVRQKRSVARYLQAEFEYQLLRGDPEVAKALLERLIRDHAREPEVAEYVLSFLIRSGAAQVDPLTGRVVLRHVPGQAGPAAVRPEAAAAPGLWTPDQPAATAPAPAPARSKLWIPGSE